MDYEAMLDRAKEILPDESAETSRFEVPKVRGHLEGSRTVVNNWSQIAHTLSRNPDHILKYILKEMATPGEIIKESVVFGSKLSAVKLNEKLVQYANDFVLCKTCGKPETKLSKEAGVTFVNCQACGAKNSVQSRI